MNLLEEVKNLSSHKNLSQNDLLKMLAKTYIEKKHPAREPKRKITAKTEGMSRYIPAYIRREVWARDKGKCTYPNCNSKHLIQHDHIIPVAMGGPTTVENLRLTCHAHNQRAAIEKLGFRKMDKYINKT
jgi:5-methylcytosine-specific restriction endonuclease McrA